MHFIVSLSVSAASQSKLGALDLDWVYSTAWPWALIETGFTPSGQMTLFLGEFTILNFVVP